jgi:hypothetical protein
VKRSDPNFPSSPVFLLHGTPTQVKYMEKVRGEKGDLDFRCIVFLCGDVA